MGTVECTMRQIQLCTWGTVSRYIAIRGVWCTLWSDTVSCYTDTGQKVWLLSLPDNGTCTRYRWRPVGQNLIKSQFISQGRIASVQDHQKQGQYTQLREKGKIGTCRRNMAPSQSPSTTSTGLSFIGGIACTHTWGENILNYYPSKANPKALSQQNYGNWWRKWLKQNSLSSWPWKANLLLNNAK